jgi:hypothetical protein
LTGLLLNQDQPGSGVFAGAAALEAKGKGILLLHDIQARTVEALRLAA